MKLNDSLNQLLKAIVSIENTEECEKFLEDICTVQELEKMAQRLEAAKLLLQGKTYEQVIEEAAYTWFNRIVAIRYMEINDILPLTKDNQSI